MTHRGKAHESIDIFNSTSIAARSLVNALRSQHRFMAQYRRNKEDQKLLKEERKEENRQLSARLANRVG